VQPTVYRTTIIETTIYQTDSLSKQQFVCLN